MFKFITTFAFAFVRMSSWAHAQASNYEAYEPYLQEIQDAVVKEMNSQFEIEYMSSAKEPSGELKLCLGASRQASIEEARFLEVNAIECFLKKIHEDERIKLSLFESPFPQEKLCIEIIFYIPSAFFYADGTVASVVQKNDKLFYSAVDPLTVTRIALGEEFYEDALEIVKNSPPREDNYCTHRHHGYEEHMNELLGSFIEEMSDEFEFRVEFAGGLMADGIEEVAIRFAALQRATIEEARILEIRATEKLLKMINSDENIRPYLKKYPFPINRTKIAIFFEKAPFSYYMDGSVACVYPVDNKLSYFTKLPSQKSIRLSFDLLFNETYEDALQIINLKKLYTQSQIPLLLTRTHKENLKTPFDTKIFKILNLPNNNSKQSEMPRLLAPRKVA